MAPVQFLEGRAITLAGSSHQAGFVIVMSDCNISADDLRLEVDPAVYDRVRASRAMVDAHVEAGDVVYGLTTGFGKLKNVAVPRADLAELQRNLIVSHCVGVGDPMPRREVRIAQVLRLNSLLRGVFDSSDLFYYPIVILAFLVLSIWRLDSERLQS